MNDERRTKSGRRREHGRARRNGIKETKRETAEVEEEVGKTREKKGRVG